MKRLRIAFSKKEKGEQLLSKLEELKEKGEVEDEQYEKKKEQYERLVEEGQLELEAIKDGLSNKVEALKRELESYPDSLRDLKLESKVGEISASRYMRQEQRTRRKVQKLRQEIGDTELLLKAETADAAGGFIDTPVERRSRRPSWL
ncbi:MAG: hypothetical protein WBC63_06725 [Candidatus Bipolaricaulia bacterium]